MIYLRYPQLDLRVEILRPHLSDKAKLLFSKMDPRHNTVYGEVKRMLLRKFKLSPAVYLERFNTEIRKTDETYLLYSARLRSILDAYTDSRMLTRHPERIPELLVSDRIKSTLPVACLNYVLSVEATKDEGWLNPHDLAETIDKYFANRGPQGDRPKAGAIGMSSQRLNSMVLCHQVHRCLLVVFLGPSDACRIAPAPRVLASTSNTKSPSGVSVASTGAEHNRVLSVSKAC